MKIVLPLVLMFTDGPFDPSVVPITLGLFAVRTDVTPSPRTSVAAPLTDGALIYRTTPPGVLVLMVVLQMTRVVRMEYPRVRGRKVKITVPSAPSVTRDPNTVAEAGPAAGMTLVKMLSGVVTRILFPTPLLVTTLMAPLLPTVPQTPLAVK